MRQYCPREVKVQTLTQAKKQCSLIQKILANIKNNQWVMVHIVYLLLTNN